MANSSPVSAHARGDDGVQFVGPRPPRSPPLGEQALGQLSCTPGRGTSTERPRPPPANAALSDDAPPPPPRALPSRRRRSATGRLSPAALAAAGVDGDARPLVAAAPAWRAAPPPSSAASPGPTSLAPRVGARARPGPHEEVISERRRDGGTMFARRQVLKMMMMMDTARLCHYSLGSKLTRYSSQISKSPSQLHEVRKPKLIIRRKLIINVPKTEFRANRFRALNRHPAIFSLHLSL